MSYSALDTGFGFIETAGSLTRDCEPYSPEPAVEPQREQPKCLGWTLSKEAEFQKGLAFSTRLCLWFIAATILSLGICLGMILWVS